MKSCKRRIRYLITIGWVLVLLSACSDTVIVSPADQNIPFAAFSYPLSGTVSGLDPGKTLVLSNNSQDTIIVNADGISRDIPFTFPTLVASQAYYNVRVQTQPDGDICTVFNQSGVVVGNISNISVVCGATVVQHLTGPEGALPSGQLLLDSLGNLYGTAGSGGAAGSGTLFKVNPQTRQLSVLHSFTPNAGDGNIPDAGLTFGLNGVLYGPTLSDGISGSGILFAYHLTDATYDVIYRFNSTDPNNGFAPAAPLLFDGTALYGTTEVDGGLNHQGIIFKLDLTGQFSVLHKFNGNDGGQSRAGLLLAQDGMLYGTTTAGGVNNGGVVFRINRSGQHFVVLHAFSDSDGTLPRGKLIQDAQGYLYGTTLSGGVGYGTVFKLNPADGAYVVLHTFIGQANDGAKPISGMIFGQDGYLYGTTSGGGPRDDGTLFRVNTTGTDFRILHFFNGKDGSSPQGELTVGNDGHFYGTTFNGGVANVGAIFRY